MRIALLLAGLMACGTTSGSPPGLGTQWDRAYAESDCAPWDGAATSVILTDAVEGAPASYPMLRISVYHGLESVDGKRWTLGASEPDGGQSVLCEQEGVPCVATASGWVDFAARGDSGSLGGTYDVRFADGRRFTGDFTAPIRATRVLCG